MTDLPIMLRVARSIMRAEHPHLVLPSGELTAEGSAHWSEREDFYHAAAKAVFDELRQGPTPQMINAGLAWQSHCSDIDSLWEEMVMAAIYPESYPATLPPLYATSAAS